MVDVQTIGVVVTAVSVSVAAIYYIFTLRINMKTQQLALRSQEQTLETRQAQLYMQLYQTSMSKDFMDSQYKLFRLELKTVEDYQRMLNDPDRARASEDSLCILGKLQFLSL